jgi:crotonobetainyl-CoA:carnitine CoA-transferase CaiB-like acyl-CoA transferase
MGQNIENMLRRYRILDLTNEQGYLCGKLLGALGADVIKIEAPKGDPGRNIGPFFHDIPDPEKSLYWFAFNTDKRSITLDVETSDGQEIFKRLVRNADVVIESFSPGVMDKLGLGYSSLSQINQRIIMTSITGFGQTGPYKDYKAPDIVVWALSGNAILTGDPDRGPLKPSFPNFSYVVAGVLQATIGTLIALYHREITGKGQQVDASAQLSLIWPFNAEPPGLWREDGTIVKRQGRIYLRPQVTPGKKTVWAGAPMLWQCKDGDIAFSIMTGLGQQGGSSVALTQWLESEGKAGETLKKIDWTRFEWETANQDIVDDVVEDFRKFFLTHTKAELLEEAEKRGIMLYPVLTPKDILKFSQLESRGYWEEVHHPELGCSITYPGFFFKTSAALAKRHRRAPLIGEHNEEIYTKELGLSREELLILKQKRVV